METPLLAVNQDLLLSWQWNQLPLSVEYLKKIEILLARKKGNVFWGGNQ